MSDTKWIVAVVKIDTQTLESKSLTKQAFNDLPNTIDSALYNAIPGALDTEVLFLLTENQKIAVLSNLEQNSMQYHDYVVNTRGELCTEPSCEKHTGCTVFKSNDYRH